MPRVPEPSCSPPPRHTGTQMTTDWGVPGRWRWRRLRNRAAMSKSAPLSTSEAQEPQARASDQPKLMCTPWTCCAPYTRAVSTNARCE